MKLKTLVNIIVLLAIGFQFAFPQDSNDCYGEHIDPNYDYTLYAELIEGKCCGYSYANENIIKDCP